jgi:glycosyltransferase involved in cell wall biosynthesis
VTRDPRARRQALAAVALGYEVVALCRTAGEEPRPLEGVRVERVVSDRIAGALRQTGLGGMRTSTPLLRELRGLVRLARLVATTVRLSRAAWRLGVFDIVHANDLDTLPTARFAAKRSDARLIYDAHEIYTEQEPDPPRLHAVVALRVERSLAQHADVVTTVGPSIARVLDERLRLARPARVILSCPELWDGEPAPPEGRLRVVYQGAMGPGRSLDDLLEAAEALEGDVMLTVRVAGADIPALREAVTRRDLGARVTIAEPVAPDALVPALAEFHVGVVINRPVTRNDEHVLPNKLFEYLMAGLAVVVPELPGMTPIVEEEQVGLTFTPSRPDLLATALDRLAADGVELASMRERARQAAHRRYNADTQASALAAVWRG